MWSCGPRPRLPEHVSGACERLQSRCALQPISVSPAPHSVPASRPPAPRSAPLYRCSATTLTTPLHSTRFSVRSPQKIKFRSRANKSLDFNIKMCNEKLSIKIYSTNIDQCHAMSKKLRIIIKTTVIVKNNHHLFLQSPETVNSF